MQNVNEEKKLEWTDVTDMGLEPLPEEMTDDEQEVSDGQV